LETYPDGTFVLLFTGGTRVEGHLTASGALLTLTPRLQVVGEKVQPADALPLRATCSPPHRPDTVVLEELDGLKVGVLNMYV
jgi:hypothetical protein